MANQKNAHRNTRLKWKKTGKGPLGPPGVTDRTLTDMKAFFHSLDMQYVWEKFYLTFDTNGTHKYKAIQQLAREIGRNDEQIQFLTWYMGVRRDEDHWDDRDHKWHEITNPQEWQEKRAGGGWYSPKALRVYSKGITARLNALEAIREAGNGITLNSLARMEQLAQQIDRDFNGMPFLPEASFKENSERAKLYVQLHSQVLGLIERAFNLYTKAHGIDFNNADTFGSILAGLALANKLTGVEEDSKSRGQRIIESIAEATLVKAQRFNIPLPNDVESKMIEIAAEPVEDPKKKVQ